MMYVPRWLAGSPSVKIELGNKQYGHIYMCMFTVDLVLYLYLNIYAYTYIIVGHEI